MIIWCEDTTNLITASSSLIGRPGTGVPPERHVRALMNIDSIAGHFDWPARRESGRQRLGPAGRWEAGGIANRAGSTW